VTIRQDALERIMAHDWPGNVRELENVIARAIILAPGGVITPESIQLMGSRSEASVGWLDNIPYHKGYWDILRQVEIRLIRSALAEAHGNKAEAARILGVRRRLLYEKLSELGFN
jgi:two-component system response regulator AtoC